MSASIHWRSTFFLIIVDFWLCEFKHSLQNLATYFNDFLMIIFGVMHEFMQAHINKHTQTHIKHNTHEVRHLQFLSVYSLVSMHCRGGAKLPKLQ